MRPGLRFLPVILFLAAGCGDNPRVVRVTGTVRSANKPIANLLLTFVPAEGRPSWAVTDENGHYTLKYDRKQEGAVRGTHKVFVAYRPSDPKQEMALQQGKTELPAELQAILKKYGDRESSPLHYEVASDGQVIDLDLD